MSSIYLNYIREFSMVILILIVLTCAVLALMSAPLGEGQEGIDQERQK